MLLPSRFGLSLLGGKNTKVFKTSCSCCDGENAMKKNRATLVLLLFLVIFSDVSAAQVDNSSKIECEDVICYILYYNGFILSKEPNTIENPRKWFEIRDYVSLSSNSRIDGMELHRVYEEFRKRLDETSKNERDYRINLRNCRGKTWEESPKESQETDRFYLIVEFKDGSTFVYNGAFVRIGITIGNTIWSELESDLSKKETEKKEIWNETIPHLKEIINDDADFMYLCHVYQIGKIKKGNSGEGINLKKIKNVEDANVGSSWNWHEGRFPHLRLRSSNYFVKGKNDIDDLWPILDSYALYYESKRILLKEFSNLENDEIFPNPKILSLTLYSGEIIHLEDDINFFLNALNAMEYWVSVMRKDPLINSSGMEYQVSIMEENTNAMEYWVSVMRKDDPLVEDYSIETKWASLRYAITYHDGVARMILNEYRQYQTVKLALIAIVVSAISIIIALASLSKRRLGSHILVSITILSTLLVLCLFFLWIFHLSGIEAVLLISGFIGFVVAYWRYELSKYNGIARRALDDFTKIFQNEVFGRERVLDLKCILMTLATFNSTHAWFETKKLVNRLSGLDGNLKFRPKTPRYFEELTQIAEAINRDNGIKRAFRFLPIIGSVFKDKNYKEWLDFTIELLTISCTGDFYQIEKCFLLLRMYIKFGLDQFQEGCIFDEKEADGGFGDFQKRHGFEKIDDHMKRIFSLKDIDTNMKNILLGFVENNFRKTEKFLVEKGCSQAQAELILLTLKNRWK